MTLKKVKYTSIRGTIYWFHIKLPLTIYSRCNLPSQLVRHSLKTDNPDKATTLAQLLAFKIKELYSNPNNPISTEIIKNLIENTLLSVSDSNQSIDEKLVTKNQRCLLSTAFKQYKSEALKSDRWQPQTQYDNTIAYDVFIELLGDIPVSDLSPALLRKYRDLLLKYPVHRNKIQPIKNLSLKEILSLDTTYPSISLTTINNHLRRMSAFLNWLNDQGYQVPNTLGRMKLRQKKSLKSMRSPFETSDLIKLFSSPIYTQLKYKHDYEYWLPLLGLYTGCRIEEISQLHLDDIYIDEEIPYLSISDKHSGQHIKSESSRRKIPIHTELMALGFMKFIKGRVTENEEMLFGYLKPQRSKYSHAPSKWFSRYKRKQQIHDSKKVFHSFRHTMAECLRQSRAFDYEIKELLGHSSGSITHDVYGSVSTAIEPLNVAIQKISFKEVLQQVKAWH
jgi:integrase